MTKYEELMSRLNPDKQYLLEERAAMIEFEGELTNKENSKEVAAINRRKAEELAVKWWNEHYIPSTYSQKSKAGRKTTS